MTLALFEHSTQDADGLAAVTPRRALRVTARFDVPAQRVFEAWLDQGLAGRWLFATAARPMASVQIDARVGGAFCFTDRHAGAPVAHTGRYLEIVPHRRLAFSLASPMHAHAVTRVAVDIVARAAGCALTLTHDGVPRARVQYTRARWTGILFGLRETLQG